MSVWEVVLTHERWATEVIHVSASTAAVAFREAVRYMKRMKGVAERAYWSGRYVASIKLLCTTVN